MSIGQFQPIFRFVKPSGRGSARLLDELFQHPSLRLFDRGQVPVKRSEHLVKSGEKYNIINLGYVNHINLVSLTSCIAGPLRSLLRVRRVSPDMRANLRRQI